MRLLILLSALLTALSGIAGPRAMAQPMATSAVATIASPRAPTAVSVARRMVAVTDDVASRSAMLPLPVMFVAGRSGYMERRRE